MNRWSVYYPMPRNTGIGYLAPCQTEKVKQISYLKLDQHDLVIYLFKSSKTHTSATMSRQTWTYPQDISTLNWLKSVKTNNSHYILKLGSNVRGSRPASAEM